MERRWAFKPAAADSRRIGDAPTLPSRTAASAYYLHLFLVVAFLQ